VGHITQEVAKMHCRSGVDQTIKQADIEPAILHWPLRFSACVKTGAEHFEHSFYIYLYSP